MIITPGTIDQTLGYIKAAQAVSLDCETSGLKQTDRPFAAIIATDLGKYYLDNRVLPDNAIIEVIQSLKGKTVRYQNAKFDMRMCEAQWAPIEAGVIEDTEVLGRLCRNDHMSYSMKSQAPRYGMYKSDAAEKYLKDHKLGVDYTKIPIDVISEYALQDARVTYDLVDAMLPTLDTKSQPVWDMEKKLTHVLYKMERTGILLDKDYTEKAAVEEERLIAESKSQFHMATGVVFDNKKSTLIEIFRKGGDIIPKTDKGNDQLDSDALESFKSPSAKIVQRIRYHEKRLSTYYSSFLELVQPSGLIHADIRQAGTTTGRLSYRDPNLQNMSKDEGSTDKYVVRGCFKPRDGYVFLAKDYKQQEYRLMLAYANHSGMIQAVMNGMDVHQATANLVGITRTYAKTLNFAILYGAGASKIAGMLGISMAQAATLKNRYFSKLIEVEQLIFNISDAGKRRGHVYNWLGRKLCINHKDFAYTLPNHIIQGGGADICKLAMLACADVVKEFDAKLILQVHDALYFEVRQADMIEINSRLTLAMESVFPAKNGMAMKVDTKWSDKSLAERDLQEWTS